MIMVIEPRLKQWLFHTRSILINVLDKFTYLEDYWGGNLKSDKQTVANMVSPS